MLGVWWMLGSDGRRLVRRPARVGGALQPLGESRRQGEHLVAVEGAPDTGLTTRGQVTTGDHLGDGLWVDTENRRGLGLHDPHAQVSSYATRRRSRACSRTAAAVSRLVVAPEFMVPF